MFENGELGPSMSPVPVFINNPLPVFKYRPFPLPSNPDPNHGFRKRPSPCRTILAFLSPLLMYIAPPDPLILSMTFEAAAEPTPAKAPVARPRSTLDIRNLTAIPSNGRIAPM